MAHIVLRKNLWCAGLISKNWTRLSWGTV